MMLFGYVLTVSFLAKRPQRQSFITIARTVAQKWRKQNEINQQKIFRLAWRVRFPAYFSEQPLSRSEPKEEEVSQTKPNEAEQAQIKPSEATESHAQPNEAQLSDIKPKQAKDSETQSNKAVVSESKPKKLKQTKEVQRLIEQGDVSGALAEAGLTKKKSRCRNRIRALQAAMESVPSALPSL